MKDWWTRLRTAFRDLAPRERLLVGSAGALFTVLLGWLLLVSPALSAGGRIHDRAESTESELEAMTRLRRQYDEVQGRLEQVERRIRTADTGNLRTTLESMARQSAVKVDSMEQQATSPSERYRETRLAVTLKEITLAQTVNYLHKIESSPQLLTVKTLRMRIRQDKPELLDVNFTVSSFEPL